MFRSISNLFAGRKKSCSRPSSPRCSRGIKPQVEHLEERQLLAGYVFNEPVDGDIWIQELPTATSYVINGLIGGKYDNKHDHNILPQDRDTYKIPVQAGTRVDVELVSSSLKDATISLGLPTDYENIETAQPNKWSHLITDTSTYRYVNIEPTDWVYGQHRGFNYSIKVTLTPGSTKQSVRPDIEMIDATRDPVANKVTFNYRTHFSDNSGPITDSLVVRLWGSKNGQLDYSSVKVKDVTVSGTGTSGSIDLTGLKLDGYTKLFVTANANYAVKESDHNNNSVEVKTLKPDIRMVALKAEQGRIGFTYEIKGKLPRDEFFIRLMQSSDAAYDNTDTKLANLRLSGSWLSEGPHTAWLTTGVNGQVKLPGAGLAEVPDGYYLVAKADPDEKIGETSGTNNTASTRPDITVSNIRFNGTTQSIAFDLATKDITKSFTVKLYQSSSATFDPKKAVVRGTMTVSATAASGAFNLKEPLKVQYGNYLHVVADPDKQVFDTGRKNNAGVCAPEIEIRNVRFDGTSAKVAYDYTAWNLSGSFAVRLYQSDKLAFDRAEATEIARSTRSTLGSSGVFSLITPASSEGGRYLHVVANPDGMAAETMQTNNVARLELPSSKASFFKIRILSGVEAALPIKVGPIGVSYQRIVFEIQPMFANGKVGRVRQLTFTAAGAGVGLDLGAYGKSDWAQLTTEVPMSIEDFQGAGSITSYWSYGAGKAGGSNTMMTLHFDGARANHTEWPIDVGGETIGAGLGQKTVGTWTVS